MASKITDKKYYSSEITKRFILAMDSIVGTRTSSGKITAGVFGPVVGISGSNLSRIRTRPGQFAVTVEAIGRLVHHYKISPAWLLTGQGDMKEDPAAEAKKKLEARVSGLEKSMASLQKSMDGLTKKLKR